MYRATADQTGGRPDFFPLSTSVRLVARSLEKEAEMAKVINCDCGYTVNGETDEELLANANDHIQSDHPDMMEKVTNEELLAMAEET
jgi:predicted small metal-binding protein